MNVMDKLREMLDTAGIPYESRIEMNENILQPIVCEADKFMRNQIVYGRDKGTGGLSTLGSWSWKFDAIYQWGSYGKTENKVETYGELGRDENGEPMVMTAEEAFKIIADDFCSRGERKDD